MFDRLLRVLHAGDLLSSVDRLEQDSLVSPDLFRQHSSTLVMSCNSYLHISLCGALFRCTDCAGMLWRYTCTALSSTLVTKHTLFCCVLRLLCHRRRAECASCAGSIRGQALAGT